MINQVLLHFLFQYLVSFIVHRFAQCAIFWVKKLEKKTRLKIVSKNNEYFFLAEQKVAAKNYNIFLLYTFLIFQFKSIIHCEFFHILQHLFSPTSSSPFSFHRRKNCINSSQTNSSTLTNLTGAFVKKFNNDVKKSK